MLTADQHAWLAAAVADAALPGIIADYLIDFSTAEDLPAVLLVYAGQAPEHQGGLPQESLWPWLGEVQPLERCLEIPPSRS